jgi:thymidine phosphorylase
MASLAQELIRIKRDGGALSRAQISAFVSGLVDGSWSEGQVAAMAMAVLLRGMGTDETVALTQAMAASGERLDWRDAHLASPVLDKHSTGGVGDKVSLILAPAVAACGALVPMISGRGLAHTGGTLDKLEALPGYSVRPARDRLLATLGDAGCAIVGAGEHLAPADARLYAIRDVTATVESVPLITASILSKKLAASLDALVIDVKCGNGAFCTTPQDALSLARTLVAVARGAGLRCSALITDMNEVLGHSAGNALEVREAIDFLTGRARDARLLELTRALAARLLQIGGVVATTEAGQALVQRALDDGAAAERFARMVAALGGPRDVLHDARLPQAPVQRDVPSPRDGVISAMDTRAIGLVVVELGGGRRRPGEAIDPRVGLGNVRPLGTQVGKGDPLARVHAADEAAAEVAIRKVIDAAQIDDRASQPEPLIRQTVP